MAEKIAEKFIAALAALEANRDVETIAALYTDNSEIGNIVTDSGNHRSAKGAREFWTHYRDTFGEVKSEFRNKIFSGDAAALADAFDRRDVDAATSVALRLYGLGTLPE